MQTKDKSTVQLWPNPVVGIEILGELEAILRRVAVLNEQEIVVAVLWPLFAHTHDAHRNSPILSIRSALPGCGKTTMANYLRAVVPNPAFSAKMSKAVVYRLVERGHVTFLLDEAETYMFNDSEMCGILNAGHTRGTSVIICVPRKDDGYEPKEFPTWAPKALMFIGTAPHTLADRSLTINMRRARASEQPERLTQTIETDLATIKRKLARWAVDNMAAVEKSDPVLPLKLRNRGRDNWRPLFALAEVVGGGWPERVRDAAVSMYVPDLRDVGELLLEAMRSLFNEYAASAITTSALLKALNSDEEAPWGAMNFGKGMTPNQLADVLRPFEIKPNSVYVGPGTLKGYKLSDCEEAFERYLPPLVQEPEGRKVS